MLSIPEIQKIESTFSASSPDWFTFKPAPPNQRVVSYLEGTGDQEYRVVDQAMHYMIFNILEAYYLPFFSVYGDRVKISKMALRRKQISKFDVADSITGGGYINCLLDKDMKQYNSTYGSETNTAFMSGSFTDPDTNYAIIPFFAPLDQRNLQDRNGYGYSKAWLLIADLISVPLEWGEVLMPEFLRVGLIKTARYAANCNGFAIVNNIPRYETIMTDALKNKRISINN